MFFVRRTVGVAFVLSLVVAAKAKGLRRTEPDTSALQPSTANSVASQESESSAVLNQAAPAVAEDSAEAPKDPFDDFLALAGTTPDGVTLPAGRFTATDLSGDGKFELCRMAGSQSCFGKNAMTPQSVIDKNRNEWRDTWAYVKEELVKAADLESVHAQTVYDFILGLGGRVTGNGEIQWRTGPLTVAGTNPAASQAETQKRLQQVALKVEEMLKDDTNPVLLAAWGYQAVNSIHPWKDGNGRSCQMFGDYLLALAKFPIASYSTYNPISPNFTGNAGAYQMAVEATIMGVANTEAVQAGTKGCDPANGSLVSAAAAAEVLQCTTDEQCASNTVSMKTKCCVVHANWGTGPMAESKKTTYGGKCQKQNVFMQKCYPQA